VNALVLTTSYPVHDGSLSGSFVRDLLLELRARGWSFDVVTPASASHERRTADPGIRVHEAPYRGCRWGGGLAHRRGIPETLALEPWKWLLAPSLAAAMAARARGTLVDRRPDLIWSHWLFPSGLTGARLARMHGVPHLATAHGADVHLLERLVRLPGARRWLRANWAETRLVAPVEHTARRVSAALGGREVGVCPLPAAGSHTRAEPCPARHLRSPLLLFLGRFEPVKGPDLLLEACAALEPDHVGEITLAGSGSLEPRLRARARRLAHPTRFPGVLGAEGKARALGRADALVISSRRLADGRGEGFPHAAMEALAAGRPVIAPREGALGDWLLDSGAGLAYEPGRCDAARTRSLALCLRRFAAEPALRDALARRARDTGRAFRAGAALSHWETHLVALVREAV
jgi:glycosyltransferase involved in cell wall biosynthesis